MSTVTSTLRRRASEFAAGGWDWLLPVGFLALAWLAIRPARVRRARVVAINGQQPAYAALVWHYGGGARPQSVIFDLTGPGGTGSVTVSGEQYESEVPLPAAFSGPYRLTAIAAYRSFGRLYRQTTTFSGEIA